MPQVTDPNANKILKKYLEEHGLSQAFVAKKMGMTLSSFNARITGLVKFDADFALKVAKVLQISPYIFLAKSYKKFVKAGENNETDSRRKI